MSRRFVYFEITGVAFLFLILNFIVDGGFVVEGYLCMVKLSLHCASTCGILEQEYALI